MKNRPILRVQLAFRYDCDTGVVNDVTRLMSSYNDIMSHIIISEGKNRKLTRYVGNLFTVIRNQNVVTQCFDYI